MIKLYIKNDREMFLGIGRRPLRGKRAIKTLEVNFGRDECKIANLKGGSMSARDYLKALTEKKNN